MGMSRSARCCAGGDAAARRPYPHTDAIDPHFQSHPDTTPLLLFPVRSVNHYPVPHDNFSEAALVILGHGSTKNDDSSAPVYQHAAELRRRNLFAEVREAFWKQEPQIKTVLADIPETQIFI